MAYWIIVQQIMVQRVLASHLRTTGRRKLLQPDDSQAARNPPCPTGLCPPQGVCGALRQLADWLDQERAGKGWFWALGVGTPFDPDKVKVHGSHVDSLDEAKRQFQVAWEMYGRTLLSGNKAAEALAVSKHLAVA
jgi:hypothetical protein